MYRYVVVDDEKTVRDGIIHLIGSIKPTFRLVGQAGDGREGIEVIHQTQPDLVISDIKMPELDGIGMFRQLRSQGMAFETVILSGYADFEYARGAIQLGAREYLLKPVDIEELRALLDRIEDSLAQTGKNVPEQAFQALVRRLLAGDDREAAAGAGVLSALKKYNCITLIRFCPVFEDKWSGEGRLLDLQEERNRWKSEKNRVLDAFYHHLCGEIGRESDQHTLLPMHERQLVILLEHREGHGAPPLCPPSGGNGMGERWIAASAPFSSSTASEDFAACHDLLRWSAAVAASPITAERVAALTPESLSYPKEEEKEIIKALYRKDREGVERAERQFRARCTARIHPPEEMGQAYSYLLSSILSLGKELSPDAFHHLDQNILRESLSESVTVEELDHLLGQVLSYLTQDEDNQYSLVVKKAMHYISRHYGEEMSLEAVASSLGITPSYLSAVFSKETGRPFSNYLTDYRINRAKQMLLAGNLKIYEVARRVGYPDEKYFSRVFRKTTGMSASSFVSRSG